jgi:hypothetical protein
LGEFEAEFHTRLGYRIAMIGLCLLLAAVFGICSYLSRDVVKVWERSILTVVVLVPPFLAVLYLMFTSRSLTLHQNGFNWKRRNYNEVVLWSDIRDIREMSVSWHGEIEITHVICIQTRLGTSIKLDRSFQTVNSVIKIIRERTLPFLLEKAESNLSSHSGVAFDKLKVFFDGLDNGKEKIAWDDVDGIAILNTQGFYEVKILKSGRKRAWFRKKLPNFPNFELFMILMDRYVPQKVKSLSPGQRLARAANKLAR